MLIAIGQNVGLETRIPGGVRQFLEQGGSVLIASDIKLTDQLSKEIGVVIDGSFAGGWPFDSYRNQFVECPLLHEHRRSARGSSRHPIFADLPNNAVVATNRPSFLSYWGLTHVPVATIRSTKNGVRITPIPTSAGQSAAIWRRSWT